LNGQDYQLSPNNGENVVHSGPEGFHHRIFEGPIVDLEGDKHVITYSLRVNHLEDNFPGTINVFVKYTVEEETKVGGFTAGKVGIEYDVRLLDDAEETAIAMTNHRCRDILTALTKATLTSRAVRRSKEQEFNYIPQ
jgi:aldose 1-epimerase